MPGKHAPASPKSFYLSLARFFGIALALVALIGTAGVMLVSGGDDEPSAAPTTTSPPPASDEPSVRPTPTATRTSASASPSPRTLPPSQVRVDVYNSTTRAGLARRVANDLQKDGYRIAEVGNSNVTDRTTIFYRSGGQDEARALLRRHAELGRVAPATDDTPGQGLLSVVLGDDYP